MECDQNKSSTQIGYSIPLFFIIILGLGLRLYHLGAESFWYDEAGVAMAAMQEGLAEAIRIARSHAAAMPLDYVVAWFAARWWGNSEWALRLPAALWSTFSLIPIFFFFKEIAGKQSALLATLMTAISPFAILFAQELRFYSALLFFYYLTTLLMILSIKHPTWRNFVLFGLIATIGIYFHLFVGLALCNGFFYLIVHRNNPQIKRIIIRSFLSLVVIGLLVLPGYLYFSHGEQHFEFGLDIPLIPMLVMQGVGWIPTYPLTNQLGWIFYVFSIIAAIVGCIFIFKKRYILLKALLISALVQILAIILADQFSGYFFAARQILFLLPFNALLISLAVYESFKSRTALFFPPQNEQNYSLVNRIFAGMMIAGLLIFSIPANADSYRMEKSTAREISELLSNQYQPGESIFVIPGWNALTFQYYLAYRLNRPDIARVVTGVSTEALYEMSTLTDQTYLIIGGSYNSVHPDWLHNMNFVKQPVGKTPAFSAELFFTRQ